MRPNGFTLYELLFVLGIVILLGFLAIPALRSFRLESDLTSSANEVVSAIRLARSRTVASEGPAQWRVYFDDTTSPNQYTLFQGPSFASRNASFDEVYKVSKSTEIY